MVWKTCQTCNGKGKVPNPDNGGSTKTCTACNGRGGSDSKTTV